MNVGFVIQPLPLQVARLKVIAIDKDEPADACARHRAGMKTSESTAPNNRYRRSEQSLLPRSRPDRRTGSDASNVPAGQESYNPMVTAAALPWMAARARCRAPGLMTLRYLARVVSIDATESPRRTGMKGAR